MLSVKVINFYGYTCYMFLGVWTLSWVIASVFLFLPTQALRAHQNKKARVVRNKGEVFKCLSIFIQILAALRSVLDTGMNYFEMTRKQAENLYEEYAWDKSDLATKDITRYQSSPATVTSYMIGQETFIKLRRLAEKELGPKFSMKEFHYQILRQGELPLKYMEEHILRFIKCKKDSSGLGCQEILS